MSQLFDLDDVEKHVGTTKALVAVEPDICPACGDPLKTTTSHQAALLRHGGYGATTRIITLHCTGKECRWHTQSEQTEVNPRLRQDDPSVCEGAE